MMTWIRPHFVDSKGTHLRLMIKIQLVVMETTKRLEPENPPQLQYKGFSFTLIFFIYNLYHLILQKPGTGVVDPYPLGEHVAAIGKVEEGLLFSS